MRARSLKPSLFHNEILAVADPIYTLAFEGLWCLADREGRLEDRPVRIQMQLFPMRQIDMNAILEWLFRENFIIRYAIGASRYIQVTNFAKHQKPHTNEKKSEIPAPDQSVVQCTTKEASQHSQGGTQDALNPSCLTPHSLTPSSQDNDDTDVSSSAETSVSPKSERCPYQQIVEIYHDVLPNHPRVRELTNARKGHMRARWTNGMEKSLQTFREYFEAVAQSKFLTGRVDPKPGQRPFVADFDFLMRESTYVKILEGKYS